MESENQPLGADQPEPLLIAKQGHFFVGGHYYTNSGGRFMAGQMYVEYQIPQGGRRVPIVMWHGGGQTGGCFTSTPDGRDGWAQFFLRQGYPVYVVDQPGRGRSAFNPHAYGPLQLSVRNTARVEKRFSASERSNAWPQAHLHTQWPGSGVAGDPVFDQLYAEQLPEMESFPRRQALNRDAGVALLERIGPAIILTHSQSGPFGWLIADARPGLVKAIVAAEPNGPPVYDSEFHEEGHLVRPYGLTAEPLAYSPPVSDTEPLSFVQQEEADAPGLLRGWLQKEPARELIHLKGVPVMLLTTESSYHAGYDHCTARYLMQAGVHTEHILLIELGIRGNGHMMMLEKNNVQIAAVIAQWLENNMKARAVKV